MRRRIYRVQMVSSGIPVYQRDHSVVNAAIKDAEALAEGARATPIQAPDVIAQWESKRTLVRVIQLR